MVFQFVITHYNEFPKAHTVPQRTWERAMSIQERAMSIHTLVRVCDGSNNFRSIALFFFLLGSKGKIYVIELRINFFALGMRFQSSSGKLCAMHYLKFRRVYVLCYMVENIISYLNFVKQLTVLKTILHQEAFYVFLISIILRLTNQTN